MSFTTVALLNGILDLGVICAVAAVMRIPFTLDRHPDGAALYSFATPFPVELAA